MHVVLETRIHADVLCASCVTRRPGHEESAVLQMPARCADVGTGNHYRGGELGTTHGTHGVFLVVRIKGLVLTTIKPRHDRWNWMAAEDGGKRQTQEVGSRPGMGEVGPPNDPRIDELGGTAALRTAPVNEGRTSSVLDDVVLLGLAVLQGLNVCVSLRFERLNVCSHLRYLLTDVTRHRFQRPCVVRSSTDAM